jgi:TatD DNase family protein
MMNPGTKMNKGKYFDTHAHYDDERFDTDREALLCSVHDDGIGLILNPGCDLLSSEAALRLSEKFDFVYAAAGFHPSAAESFDKNSISGLRALAASPRVRAIGEIGLDYHYMSCEKQVQLDCFSQQMELARELKLR